MSTVAQRQIQGRKAPGNLHEEAMRVLGSQRSLTYECHKFLVPSPVTDEDINMVVNHATDCTCGRAAGAFDVVKRAQRVAINNDGDGELGVKYNTTAQDRIAIADGLRHDWDFTEVDMMFLTNTTGSAIPVVILLG